MISCSLLFLERSAAKGAGEGDITQFKGTIHALVKGLKSFCYQTHQPAPPFWDLNEDGRKASQLVNLMFGIRPCRLPCPLGTWLQSLVLEN